MLFRSGDIGLTYRVTKDEQGEKTSQLAPTLNLRALSYIYEPWFAIWFANLSFANVQTSGGKAGTDSQVLTGRGQIDLFPQSRFPGRLFIEATDTRISSDRDVLELGDYRLYRYGYNQRYLSADGRTRLFGGYEGSREDRLDTGEQIDIQELEFNGLHQMGNHRFEGNALLQQTTRDLESADTGFYVANLSHGYVPGPNLAVNSNLSLAYNEVDSTFENASLSGIGFSNRVDWRVAPRFRLTSELILDHREGDSNLRGQESEELADLSVFGVYDLRSDLTISGEVAANVRRGASDQERTRQSLAVVYSPLAIVFGPLVYTYGLGVGARNDTNEDGTSQNYAANGSHGLSYSRPLGDGGWTLVLDGTQTAEHEEDTAEGPLTTLSHRAAATASRADARGSTYGLLSLYDFRNYGRSEIELQQLTATLSHSVQLDRYQSIVGIFSANAGRTTNDDVTNEFAFASLTASYFNQRFLGVRNLDFDSEVRAEYTTNRISLELDPDLPIDRPESSQSDGHRLSWRNDLDYHIGLLTLSLRTDIVRTQNGNSWTVFAGVTRSF